MTSIPTGAASTLANIQSLRSMLGDVKFIDIKNASAVSAASDFAFNVADSDKDASLSVDEFVALGKKSPSDAKAQALFAAMDGDSDGKLNSHEVRASGLLSPGNIQALLGIDDVGGWMVGQADGNGDGGLSYDEYVNSRGAGPVKATFVGPNGEKTELSGMRLDAMPSVFNAMDGDGDGRLSATELGAHLQAQEGYAQYNPSSGAERMSDGLMSRNDADFVAPSRATDITA
jgi:Ca2+-binding EF-hand superfamily protein